MSGFIDNFLACYAYAVISICRFAEDFALTFQALVLQVILLYI